MTARATALLTVVHGRLARGGLGDAYTRTDDFSSALDTLLAEALRPRQP